VPPTSLGLGRKFPDKMDHRSLRKLITQIGKNKWRPPEAAFSKASCAQRTARHEKGSSLRGPKHWAFSSEGEL